MKQSFLIDGYNLVHALGLLPKKAGPGGLEKARLTLLHMLEGLPRTPDGSPALTVVFDAAKARSRGSPEMDYHGIKVMFATGGLLADDVIETLIKHDPAPKQLTIVSNDHRLQQAARRRRATVMSCESFLDLLARKPQEQQPAAEVPEPDTLMTEEETRRWLREFGTMDKELGDTDVPF